MTYLSDLMDQIGDRTYAQLLPEWEEWVDAAENSAAQNWIDLLDTMHDYLMQQSMEEQSCDSHNKGG